MDTIDREEVDEVCALAEAGKQDYDACFKLSRMLLEPIEDEASDAKMIACCKGCDYCCHLRIEAYEFELDTIYAYYLHELNSEQQAKIKEAIVERYPIVKDLGDQEQRSINVRCPFLIDRQCSIYPVRPMSCAGYSSCDDALCKRSNDDPNDTSFGIPQDQNISYMKMRQMALVQMALDLSFEEEHEIISGMHRRLLG